jgi:hypothetical protein
LVAATLSGGRPGRIGAGAQLDSALPLTLRGASDRTIARRLCRRHTATLKVAPSDRGGKHEHEERPERVQPARPAVCVGQRDLRRA